MVHSYIALDLETTGLEAKLDKIIEIAALKVQEGEVKERFVTLINPMRCLGEKVIQLTGITDQMVKEAPSIEHVIAELVEFSGDFPLLGHNILFDYSFLKRAAVNHGLEFERQGIDTLKLCRRFMPEDTKRSLSHACAYFQIPQSQAHRAEADAWSAHCLYQELVKRFGEEGFQYFTEKPLIYKAKRDQPATKRQKEYLQDLIKCHRINLSVQTDAISRSEASRLIDKIILQYGKPTYKKDERE